MRIHGVLLSAGLSTRFGSPKALAAYAADPTGARPPITFLERLLANFQQAGVDPVHLVVNRSISVQLHSDAPHILATFPSTRLIENPHPELGQMRSLSLGLASAQLANAEAILVTLIDLPLAHPATFARLAEAARQPESLGKLVVPRLEGHRGHPYVVPTSLLPAFIEAEKTGKHARQVLDNLEPHCLFLDLDDPGIRRDIDSRDEYVAAGLPHPIPSG